MKQLLLLTLIVCQLQATAQPMTFQAKRLKYLYEQLEAQPHAPVLQIEYIQEFPGDKMNFIEVFNSHTEDELSTNGKAYVKRFRKLGMDFPDSVLPKSINIGKELPAWSAGPVDELQKGIYYITHDNPQLFVDLVRELKKEEQAGLAKFLYSSPDGKNPNYDIIVEIFNRSGDRKIKKIFTEAPIEKEEDE